MLTVVICVGSSCYVRGSERLADALARLVREHELEAKVELTGAFCMECCSMGVSVRVGDRLFTQVDPAEAQTFFTENILACASRAPGRRDPIEADHAPDR